MYYCSQCGNAIDENAKFCSKCGAPVAASAPVQPAYSQPTYTQPAPRPAEVCISPKTKALGFVGMGLGIAGLFFAVLGLLYTLIGITESGLGFGLSIGFGLFSMPLGIVGRVLATQSMENGNTSGSCTAGANLGLAAIIVTCVMLFFGFINLMV